MENLFTATFDQICAYAHYLWHHHEQGYVQNNTMQCIAAAKELEEVDRVVALRFNTIIKLY